MKKLAKELTSYSNNYNHNEFEELFKHFHNKYHECFMDQTKPYEGIIEILKKLNENGIKIAINTNKNQEYTDRLVEKYFKDIKFDFVYGVLDNKHCKPMLISVIKLSIIGNCRNIKYFI